MVSSLVLDDETLVALNALEDGRLLNGPGADVGPFLLGVFLLRVRNLPAVFPVVGELLEERSLDGSRLKNRVLATLRACWGT